MEWKKLGCLLSLITINSNDDTKKDSASQKRSKFQQIFHTLPYKKCPLESRDVRINCHISHINADPSFYDPRSLGLRLAWEREERDDAQGSQPVTSAHPQQNTDYWLACDRFSTGYGNLQHCPTPSHSSSLWKCEPEPALSHVASVQSSVIVSQVSYCQPSLTCHWQIGHCWVSAHVNPENNTGSWFPQLI